VTHKDLWPSIEPLLAGVERPARYIDREWGAAHSVDADYRAVLIYPDTYEIGMANQGLAILYERLNSTKDVAAERAYVPWEDMSSAMRSVGVPLFSLESCAPVSSFDLVGITLPYELTYSNVLEVLDLADIPLRACDRGDGDPLVLGGGPCAYNPEPVAPFFDAILIGEGEEGLIDVVAAHRKARDAGSSRSEMLRALAQVHGVYVPSLYTPVYSDDGALVSVESSGGAPDKVSKRVVQDLSAHPVPTCPVVPFMDVVHDRATVEILRGCTRGCRFCQAGMVYRPVRERPADMIIHDVMENLACTGYEEVSLTSLSTTDHSQIEEILRRLRRRLEGSAISVSLPSLRVDRFGVSMARLASSGKKSGLTFAPEAGTQRLRDAINKNVNEEELLATVEQAFQSGWRRVKLYFMIGLPTETDEDVRGIGEMVTRVFAVARAAVPPDQRGAIRVGISVSTLVPKAHTPYQWEPQISLEEVRRRQSVLRESMPRKGVDLSWHDSDVSFLEATMARGGRQLSDVIENAWRSGARFDAWTENYDLAVWRRAFDEAGIVPESIANQPFSFDDVLPWGHISCGASETYLIRERQRTDTGQLTEDCSFGGCTGCDVCDDLGVDVKLGGTRGHR